MKLRLAGPDDVGAIADVHIRSSRAAYANLPASVVSVDADARRIRWAEALEEPASRVWVAEEGGRVVGFCHLRVFAVGSPEAGSAEVLSLYVEPARWREGLGRALMDRARHFAAERGCARLFLKVYVENDRACAAYEAMGFTAAPGTLVHERTGLLLREYSTPLR